MRGSDKTSGSLFSYVDLETRIPEKHPLRVIREIVNDTLAWLDAEFSRLYEDTGRESVAPERLLRASLLQAFYSVRSERQLMEQLNYNLLFRWFVGLGVDDPVWDHSTFSKNRDRLLDADVAAKFLAAVLRHAKVKRFLSDEHFSVDGTLIEAWASLKSFRAKDGSDEPPSTGRNGERQFHGEKRKNDTHASTTDPDAKLYRKSNHAAAKLSYIGHALAENRHGLIVEAAGMLRPPEMPFRALDGAFRLPDMAVRNPDMALRVSDATISKPDGGHRWPDMAFPQPNPPNRPPRPAASRRVVETQARDARTAGADAKLRLAEPARMGLLPAFLHSAHPPVISYNSITGRGGAGRRPGSGPRPQALNGLQQGMGAELLEGAIPIGEVGAPCQAQFLRHQFAGQVPRKTLQHAILLGRQRPHRQRLGQQLASQAFA